MQQPRDCEDERRSRLLTALPAIAWSASAQTFRFTYVNPAAETLLGYPAQRWLDEPSFWSEHLHPEDWHVPMLCHNETVAGQNHELVYRMIAADGRTVWLRDYVNVYTVNGVAVELFGIMVDITREHDAEAVSRESRENFRRMVELSPDCIGVYVDERYIYVNQAFVQLLGAQHAREIVGRSVFSFVDEAYWSVVHDSLARLERGESVPYIRERYVRINGSPLEVEVAALPIRYGDHDAVQIIARDITDRVRAEEELQVRESRLQLLASGTHEAIWEWFPERRELWTNDAYRQMFDVPVGPETFFEEWLSRVHPDDRENALAEATRALDEELPAWGQEYRLRQTDGTYRIVLDRGHNLRSPAGERRVIGAMLDVTSMREAEHLAQQALEASEQRYRQLVDDVSDILYTVDLEGNLVSLSRSFERSTGYRDDEWIGRPFAELFAVHSAPVALDHFVRAIAGDAGIIREYDLVSRLGVVVTVEVSAQPRYVDGVLAGTIGMARDVTERRTIARKLEEVKRMSSLGQVAASLAHEFNNVLMGIQPFVEVIERHVSATPAITNAVGHITRAVNRGKRASQEILRFANPKESQLSSIDIRLWLPALVGQLMATLPSSIALSSILDPDVRFIRGDCAQLEQVITNLVFNARDAITGSGTIHITVSSGDPDHVQISVSDDGFGSAPVMLERIFEPLFTTKRNGTGLGLAIARRLMEGQGGTLTAENRSGGGSTFHLLVPAATALPEVPTAAYATPAVTRLLLVEDDESVGAGLKALLNSEG
ncbi:MAG TPA: PAS domain S-box protein, partial [Thermoanaerobaculia bacterium]|nr:PAS domain S-box protein [Thermoanaerobaculia bacterium]